MFLALAFFFFFYKLFCCYKEKYVKCDFQIKFYILALFLVFYWLKTSFVFGVVFGFGAVFSHDKRQRGRAALDAN